MNNLKTPHPRVKNSNRTSVFVVGGLHLKKVNTELLKDVRFDALMREGVSTKGLSSFDNLAREPFFVLGAYLWFSLLGIYSRLFGGDMQSLDSFAKKSKMPVHIVDASITDLVNFIHTPFNLLIMAGIFLLVAGYMAYFNQFELLFLLMYPHLGYLAYPAILIILLLFFCLFYFGYVVWMTIDFRNKEMVKKMTGLIEEKGYKSVLFYAGKFHRKGVADLLKKENFDVRILQA